MVWLTLHWLTLMGALIMLDKIELVARPEGWQDARMGKSLVCLTDEQKANLALRARALLANRPRPPEYEQPLPWCPAMFIYFITSEAGPVKIGTSAYPPSRLRTLQISSPVKLMIAATFPGGFEQERYLHDYFARERLSGEWFRRSRRLKKYLLSLMEGE